MSKKSSSAILNAVTSKKNLESALKKICSAPIQKVVQASAPKYIFVQASAPYIWNVSVLFYLILPMPPMHGYAPD